MRALVVWGAALAFALAATAQDAGPPDVPTGDATIEGRVVDAEQERAIGDVGVILYSLEPNGDPGLRQTQAAEDGSFRFEGVSADPAIVYLVGTRVGGVPFGTRLTFETGQQVRQVEIEVAEPSRDASQIVASAPQLRFERGCSHLRLHHQQTLTNASDRVVFIPEDAREATRPLFEILLPEGATRIETPVGTAPDGFEQQDGRLRYFGPVYPGTTTLEFSYGLPLVAQSSLRIGFPGGAESVRILSPEGATRIGGEGLREEGETPLETGVHRSQRSAAIAPGEALTLDVGIEGASEPSRVTLGEARLWLELDDASMDVNELYVLRVEGDAPLTSSSDVPLLCLSLPSGAESLRFSSASMEMGLSRDPDGTLGLRGPIPAGDSSLSLRYRLPTAVGPTSFEREFLEPVELLTVLVADTGLVPEAGRLHRRRPIRTEDRAYLHLEAFGIQRGERVSLGLNPLPTRKPLPTLAAPGFVLLVAVAALFYLIAPLRGKTAAELPAESSISRERQAVYVSIQDLDDDFETGKVSSEDHERMRAELRSRAVALLQAERERAAEPKAATPPFCRQCGAKATTGDRFCAQCGTALSPPGPPPGS